MPVFHVEDYGAVGNGATDDRAAIDAAVQAAIAAGGGAVWFAPGKSYRVGPSATVSESHNAGVATHGKPRRRLTAARRTDHRQTS